MTTYSRIRHGLVALALVLAAAPAVASEMRSAGSQRVSGIVIHDAAETLRDFCRTEGGRLWLVLPGGSRWELVTSTSDPAIGNPGDGSFHPYDEAEVRDALESVRFPLRGISAEVFILPYPRRLSLESAAGPGLILLSPGVRKLPRVHQHSEFVHELGHVIQYAVMPDHDEQAWNEYMRLRGLDAGRHRASAPHAERPHEIWAEDFRALYGGAAATANGTIENADLPYPTQVAGLEAFLDGVARRAEGLVNTALLAAPRGRGAVDFSRLGERAAVLDVFDAQGRRLASVEPRVDGGSVSWSWDGLDRAGRPVATSVVFARARDSQGGAVRVAIVR
jgi:hypothetical protein